MTKKSLGRQQRDAARIAQEAQEKRSKAVLEELASGNNSCWDDLAGIHQGCQALLLKHVHLGRELNDKELLACIDDKKLLVTKIQSLAGDLRTLTGELAEINKQHSGKVGGVDDPDELMKTYAIFEQYNLFKERHEAVVIPTVLHILEQIQAAENKLNEKLREAANAASATDPKVVTDVAFEEVAA